MKEFIRKMCLWPTALIDNFWLTLLGIMNPREFMVYSFGYIPKGFLDPKNHGDFRQWFDSTVFGWWWTCTHHTNEVIVKRRVCLQWINRIRFVLAMPTELIYIPFSARWEKDYWIYIKARLRYDLVTIRYGYYKEEEV